MSAVFLALKTLRAFLSFHLCTYNTIMTVCAVGQGSLLKMIDNDISFLLYRWNDKKAKMHYVLFCMPEVSPFKLYLLRKGTDPNRYICVI